jgi:hypothetical protein
MVFSQWFKKLHVVKGTPVPVNATFGSLGIVTIFALLNLGGTEVFDSAYLYRHRPLDGLFLPGSMASLIFAIEHVLRAFEFIC